MLLLALGFLFGSSVQLLKEITRSTAESLVSADEKSQQPPASTVETCYEKYLPKWVHGDPEIMAKEFQIGSQGLSDKYDDGHRFFYAYQPYLSKLVLNKLESSSV